MKIKKIIASLLAIAVMGVSVPGFSAVFTNISVTASAEEDYTEAEYDDFRVKQYSDHIEIIKYNGSSAEVKIPSEIEGLPVTSIGDEAFKACESLTSVILPNSLTSIGDEAFYYCRDLTSITIPDSVTSIGDCAFANCEKLTSITILNPECAIYNAEYTISNSYDFDEDTDEYSGIIKGYSGSTAEKYAKEYDKTFESLGESPIQITTAGSSLSSESSEESSSGVKEDAEKKSNGLTAIISVALGITAVSAAAAVFIMLKKKSDLKNQED